MCNIFSVNDYGCTNQTLLGGTRLEPQPLSYVFIYFASRLEKRTVLQPVQQRKHVASATVISLIQLGNPLYLYQNSFYLIFSFILSFFSYFVFKGSQMLSHLEEFKKLRSNLSIILINGNPDNKFKIPSEKKKKMSESTGTI